MTTCLCLMDSGEGAHESITAPTFWEVLTTNYKFRQNLVKFFLGHKTRNDLHIYVQCVIYLLY